MKQLCLNSNISRSLICGIWVPLDDSQHSFCGQMNQKSHPTTPLNPLEIVPKLPAETTIFKAQNLQGYKMM